jgi:hypothetical protein
MVAYCGTDILIYTDDVGHTFFTALRQNRVPKISLGVHYFLRQKRKK